VLLVLSALSIIIGVGVAIDIVMVARKNRIPERMQHGQDPTTEDVIVDLNRRS
jgi:hypothetical protein